MTHWAFTVDGSANFVVYRNGNRIDCGAPGRNFNGAVPVTDRPNSFVGKSNWGHDALFRGVITDLRFYHGRFDDNFVRNLFNGRRDSI